MRGYGRKDPGDSLTALSSQPGGFTIEISNNSSTMVMTGMRIQIGTQAIERAPSYIEIFGRTMQLNLSRSRWFDFPFTREEALQADRKLSLFSESASQRGRLEPSHGLELGPLLLGRDSLPDGPSLPLLRGRLPGKETALFPFYSTGN